MLLGLGVTALPTQAAATSPLFKYVWKRDGVAIAKATASTYKLVAADSGHAISVTVTGAADYTCTGTPYIPVTKTSEPVSVTG